MGILYNHGPCHGIKLWQWNQLTIELWYVPKGFEIEPHSHPAEDLELYHVWGFSRFCRMKDNALKYVDMPLWSGFKHFTVPAGWTHWFSAPATHLVFLNVARWKPGTKPSSASVDFQPS